MKSKKGINSQKVKLICFDIDGTLVDGVSWLILTEGLGCSAQRHMDIFHAAKAGKISFIEGERQLTKMYQDGGNATKRKITTIFSEVKLRPEVKELFSYLKRKNYLIYLISGAIDLYVKEVTKNTKADGFYANSSLEFSPSGVLQKINYRDNQGGVKLEQLRELITKLNIKMKEVFFVGDSENDIEVFKATKHGIAVHCFDDNLKKEAWKVIDNLKQIKNIL